jgi:hypothetical protein
MRKDFLIEISIRQLQFFEKGKEEDDVSGSEAERQECGFQSCQDLRCYQDGI